MFSIRSIVKTLLFFLIYLVFAINTAGSIVRTFTLSGSVTGLVAGSKMVIVNGKDEKIINKNGNFTFAAALEDGAAYEITIKDQPETLRCVVFNGEGKVNGADVKNVVVTCPMAFLNGLVWMRCSQGQAWNAAAGNCTGVGKANSYGAVQLRLCAKNDNSCNGGVDGGAFVSGEAFDSCNSLNSGPGGYGITKWRLPSKDELSAIVVCTDGTPVPLHDYGTDPYRCGWNGKSYSTSGWKTPALDSILFPNTMSLEYWTGTGNIKNPSSAWYTAFQNGWTHSSVKSNRSFVRCVAEP